jgi:chemotaxis protein MotB
MAKKHKGGEHGEIHADERWLITYADMITLLLAVFIVMYALSDTNLRKFNAFAQSLSSAFNTDVMSGTNQFTITEGQATTPDQGTAFTSAGFMGADASTVKAAVKDYAIRHGGNAGVSVDVVDAGIRIRLNADALAFEPGRAVLQGTSVGTLENVVATVLPMTYRIRIEGNTDDNPVDGPFFASNFELSAARAMTVLSFMEAAGVAPERLSMAGNGEYNPVVHNDTAGHRAENRRVDIFLINPNAITPNASPSPAVESIAPSFAPVFGG